MPIRFQGRKISRMGALTEPSTYDADITPENMQHGMIGYAQGKKVVGTGRCFEFVQYGTKVVREITDFDGSVKHGISLDIESGANLVFVASSTIGDSIAQTTYLVNMAEGVTEKIGQSLTDGGDLYASYKNGRLTIYLSNEPKERTMLRLFVGKDNEI